MDEAIALLDVLQPPSDWCFSTGVWVTHDLATTVLADLVLPALTGVATREAKWRRELGRSELQRLDGSLTVLACPGRIAYGAATPGVTILPVGGRRLHAKFGLLQFRPESPDSSTKRRTRAIVTSANLTRGGLLRHREVVAWEESGDHAGVALAADLLKLLKELGEGLQPVNREVVRYFVAKLRNGLSPDVQLTRRVYSSGMQGTGVPCLAKVAKPATGEPVTRVVIVTPPFASDQDAKAVEALGPLLSDRPVVDLYTALPPGTPITSAGLPRLTFSSKVLSDLRAAAGELRIHGVPELFDDPDGQYVRRLHAKVVAAVSGSSARLWVGSANLTGRGLGGRNREVMLERTCSQTALNRFLASLGGVSVDEQEPPLPPAAEFTDDPPEDIDLRAVFWVASGQSSSARAWEGELHLLGEIPDGHTVEYEGQKLEPLPVQRLLMFENRCRLDLVWGTRRTPIPVEVCAEDASFWSAQPDDRPPKRPPGVDEFLADIRLTVAAGSGGGGTKNGLLADTVFRIPIEQRLVMVARAHRQLSSLPSGTLLPRITTYLRSGTAATDDVAQQLLVADALVAHATGAAQTATDDQLLTGLVQFLEVVGAKEPAL